MAGWPTGNCHKRCHKCVSLETDVNNALYDDDDDDGGGGGGGGPFLSMGCDSVN